MSKLVRGIVVAAVAAVAQYAFADASGTWTASFETQVGTQNYTYELHVQGATLTGTAKSNLVGEVKLADGKVDGNKISFVENAKFQDMELRIVYSGTLTSDNEMKLSRNVADLATEELVAKRVK